MTETHPGAELDQPRGLGRERGLGGDPELLGCAAQQGGVADRFGGRGQQQPLRLGREQPELPVEALFEAVRERLRVGTAEPAGQLRRGQSAGQLRQRERVPPRLGDDPVPHQIVQPPGHDRLQQRAGVSVAQARDRELRKPRQVLVFAGFAHREDHGDRFRQQAARDEREGLRRSPVEPLRVVDQADQRPFLSHLGEQSERREADGIAVWRRPGAQAERRAQRVALRIRQARQAVQQGRAQLMQDGERQFHLGLDTGRAHHATAGRVLLDVVQQDGLADSRLTAQDQHPAVTRAHLIEQPVQCRLLAIPTTQCLGHDHPRHSRPRQSLARRVSCVSYTR